MKARYDQSKFIKILEEAPFISYAAKKSGISRATIYRWKKNNQDFRDAVNETLKRGIRHLCDVAEMALVEKIKAKDMGAIKFYLQHNDERYRPMRAESIPRPKNELKPGETCEACGLEKAPLMSNEEMKGMLEDYAEYFGFTLVPKQKQ